MGTHVLISAKSPTCIRPHKHNLRPLHGDDHGATPLLSKRMKVRCSGPQNVGPSCEEPGETGDNN